MTISVSISTGSHKARVARTGFNDVVLDPDTSASFAVYTGVSITITEESEGVVAQPMSGGNGPPPQQS